MTEVYKRLEKSPANSERHRRVFTGWAALHSISLTHTYRGTSLDARLLFTAVTKFPELPRQRLPSDSTEGRPLQFPETSERMKQT